MSNEVAQAELDAAQKAVLNYSEKQGKVFEETKAGWRKESENDKEFGGDKFKESAELASRVFGKYGNDALKTALNESGLGNHPELVRMAVKIGQAMKDDEFIHSGSKGGGQEKSAADTFYDKTETASA